MDSGAREILDSIRRLVRALRESSSAAEKAVGLSGAQLFVLQKLGDGRPLSVNELAERTLTHQSSVSVVVRKLCDQGLVARKPSPRDGRRVELTLTARGRRLLERAPGAAQDRLIEALGRLPARLRGQLAA